METINFELSKRLNDLGLLDNIETEYCYNVDKDILPGFYAKEEYSQIVYKTLTLDESIEFLPYQIKDYYFVFGKNDNGYWSNYLEKDENELYILDRNLLNHIHSKETPIEVIEAMLEFLLDNNLLIK